MRPISQAGQEDGIGPEAGYRAGERPLEPHIGFRVDAALTLGAPMLLLIYSFGRITLERNTTSIQILINLPQMRLSGISVVGASIFNGSGGLSPLK